jgi:hypothetical protein
LKGTVYGVPALAGQTRFRHGSPVFRAFFKGQHPTG